jgi:superfamily I DNA/RNA helicase
LVKSLQELLDEGLNPEDITILTPHTNDEAIQALTCNEERLHRLVSLSQSQHARLNPGGRIRYGTIHSFKGLESPAVVVAGVDEVASERGASLLYVALSRALHRLVILMSEDLRSQILALLDPYSMGD